jgi:hypothetical protein
MKQILVLLFLSWLPAILLSQTSVDSTGVLFFPNQPTEETIVDKINHPVPGKGEVRIIQDESIANLIGRIDHSENEANKVYNQAKMIEINGWRIQLFSGNNQRSSKDEAFKMESDIKSRFPAMQTYVTYKAPFWRLRAGDFQTFKDANDELNRLKKAFPTYGREMSIVKEKILIEE